MKYVVWLGLAWFIWPFTVMAIAPAAGDSTVSSDKILSGTFANDATFLTDYYFTQGITANLVHPILSKSPVNKILLKLGRSNTSYHGIKITYDGFTPLLIYDPELRVGDHPYASYIFVTQYRILDNQVKKYRLTVGLDLGFIGPGTGAGKFQAKVHQWLDAPKPKGWQYQVQTDVVLNYQAAFEKQIGPRFRAAELIGLAGASLGTLNTSANGGLLLRTGKMNAYFQNLGVSSRENRRHLQKFQFYGQGRVSGKLVGYNATLQGGLFNRHNPYTLAASQVARTVLQKSAGLVCSYGSVSFESSVVWISPEFDQARRHKWMHFDLRIAL